MNKKQIFFIIFAGLLLVSQQTIQAFQFSPINVSLSPHGSGSKKAFQLVNRGDRPEAIQISMVVREMDMDGTETYVDAEDDFIVYPSQIILMPNTTRTIRLQWIGDPNPEGELAYRIIAEQLPIDFKKEENGKGATIRVNIRYMGAVYIVPKAAKPDVVIESALQQKDKGGAAKLVILLHNRGTAHRIIKDFRLHLNDGIELESDQLEEMNGSNILAGHKRRFVLPWPDGLGDSPLNARIEFVKRKG